MRLSSILVVLTFLLGMTLPLLAENKPTDDQIHDRVMQRLATDRDVKGGAIDIEVKQGVVTLKGKVRQQKQKNKAEHLAHKVKGVTQVINQLEVVPTAP